MDMKGMLKMIMVALIGALLVAVISFLPISATFKSILYAILVIVFVYIIALLIRIEKK